MDCPNVGNLYRIEIVVTQHHHIAKFAHFERAKVGLLLEEPAVVDGVEADRLFTRGMLAEIDLISSRRFCP